MPVIQAVRKNEADRSQEINNQSCLSMPLVSVIIPCYNQDYYLGEAIESVLAQSYANFEIVIVDDGSIDKTSEVAASYPDVQCIRQENQGLAAARNTGLRMGRGDYLVFLDADDLLVPQALEAGLKCLEAHPACAFVSGHYRYINADGSFLNEHPQEQVGEDYYLALLQGNYIGMHATVMYRRAALETIGGFDPALPACEDYDLYLRLARKFPVSRHGKVIAEYRQHGSNMSGNAELMLKTALAVLHSQAEYVKADKPYQRAYQMGLNFWQKYYGEKLLAQIIQRWACGQGKQAIRGGLMLLQFAPQYSVKHGYQRMAEVGYKFLQAILPVFIYRRLARWRGLAYTPAAGRVDFGDLRRVQPLSQEFGYDRGRPVDRYYIENFLASRASDIRGRVLEIGDDSYTRQFGGEQVTIRDVLHAFEGNPQATIVADLARADHIPANTFDCLILTQTLHLLYDIRAAIQTLHRILKPGGVLLATVPGISQISIDEWADSWYWAFTVLSIRRLFEETFAAENLEIQVHGNVLAATAFLNGLAAEELCQDELDYADPHYQLLITIRAIKKRRKTGG
jgi:glycosyltransferase involved in cell wall biosynthesis